MTIEIELDGARRQVTLRREGDRWIAGIDGREVAVSVAEAGGQWSMLIGPASYNIAFEPVATGELIVHVNGVAVPLTVVNEPGPPKPWAKAARARHGIRDGGAAEEPLAIVAPMPGRIVRVLVKLNETVAGAAAFGGRRGHEDGERAARAARRHGHRGSRPRRGVSRGEYGFGGVEVMQKAEFKMQTPRGVCIRVCILHFAF